MGGVDENIAAVVVELFEHLNGDSEGDEGEAGHASEEGEEGVYVDPAAFELTIGRVLADAAEHDSEEGCQAHLLLGLRMVLTDYRAQCLESADGVVTKNALMVLKRITDTWLASAEDVATAPLLEDIDVIWLDCIAGQVWPPHERAAFASVFQEYQARGDEGGLEAGAPLFPRTHDVLVSRYVHAALV
jgi:hypothetical protein